MVDSNIPSVAYATVYPIAMVFLILFIQVIASAVIDISNKPVGDVPKVVNTFGTFFIWMNVVFLFIDMRRKKYSFCFFYRF